MSTLFSRPKGIGLHKVIYRLIHPKWRRVKISDYRPKYIWRYQYKKPNMRPWLACYKELIHNDDNKFYM